MSDGLDGSAPRAGGSKQEIRPGPGSGPGRLRRPAPARSSASSATTAPASRRWSRRSPGSTRRRRDDPLRRRGGARSTGPRTRPNWGSRPSTRTWRSATTSTSSPTSSSASEEISPGPGRGLAPARRGEDGAPDRRAALEPGGDDPQPAQRGRHALRRPAPAGRRRPLAARRAEGRAARRADRGARRAADRAGAGADPAPARARPRRRRDQPQPGRRLRGRRPDLRPAARQGRRRVRRRADRPRSTSSRAITGVGGERNGRDGRRQAGRARDRDTPATGDGRPRRPRRRATDAPPVRPGRPRLAAGRPRPGRDLDHLPVAERPLPLGREPDQPDAADHRGRPDLGRHRLRPAARRDRPLGRRGQRARRRGDGGAQRQARLEPLPGDRRRRSSVGAAIGLLQGFLFSRFGVPSFVVTLAGLLAWQGALLQVLGSTGSINITDPKITGLANTFYSDTVGWIFAAVVDRRLRGPCSRRLPAPRRRRPRPARARRAADRPLRRGRRGRRSPPSRSSTPTAACRWRC